MRHCFKLIASVPGKSCLLRRREGIDGEAGYPAGTMLVRGKK